MKTLSDFEISMLAGGYAASCFPVISLEADPGSENVCTAPGVPGNAYIFSLTEGRALYFCDNRYAGTTNGRGVAMCPVGASLKMACDTAQEDHCRGGASLR